jgi:hypothetical protein
MLVACIAAVEIASRLHGAVAPPVVDEEAGESGLVVDVVAFGAVLPVVVVVGAAAGELAHPPRIRTVRTKPRRTAPGTRGQPILAVPVAIPIAPRSYCPVRAPP